MTNESRTSVVSTAIRVRRSLSDEPTMEAIHKPAPSDITVAVGPPRVA